MRLANFPLANQLADTNEVNASFDCVPTSIAACLEFLTGKKYDGGAIKDAVYGAGYQGGTAASQYVNYCKDQGVNLFAMNGNPAQLVQDIIAQLKLNHPVIVTEPDPYAKPSLGWSHVVAMCGYDDQANTLTCMDPFGGKFITLPDAQWQTRLEFNQVWALEHIGGDTPMLQLSDPMGKFFTATDESHWHCTVTNQPLSLGFLSFFRQINGIIGLPLTGEFRLPQYPNAVFQIFERAGLVYNPQHDFDASPGLTDIFLLHLDKGPGQAIVAKPLLTAMQGQVDTLTKQVADLTSELATLKAQPPTDTSTLEQQLSEAQAQLTLFKQAVASVEATCAALPK